MTSNRCNYLRPKRLLKRSTRPPVLTSVEGVALGANFDVDLGLGGTSLDDVAASAGDGAVNVVRMDTLFHSFHLISGSDLLGPYYKCMCPSQPSISATPSSGLGNDCLTIIARIDQNARGKFKFFTAFAASSLFLLPVAPAPGKKASAAQC